MNPFFKSFIVQRPDGSVGYNYRALVFLVIGVCTLNLLLDFFVTHGPIFPAHR